MSKLLVLIVLAVLQSACMTQPQHITGSTAAHTTAELKQWQASGRIGITAIDQSGSGGFTWEQNEAVSQIQLRGPVGVGSLAVSVDGSGLSLLSSEGTSYSESDALLVMQEKLGVVLPVTQLRYWLLGTAAPSTYRWLDATHQLLEQDGWLITYQQWTERNQLSLPIRLILQQGAVRIVVVIQAWNLS